MSLVNKVGILPAVVTVTATHNWQSGYAGKGVGVPRIIQAYIASSNSTTTNITHVINTHIYARAGPCISYFHTETHHWTVLPSTCRVFGPEIRPFLIVSKANSSSVAWWLINYFVKSGLAHIKIPNINTIRRINCASAWIAFNAPLLHGMCPWRYIRYFKTTRVSDP